MAYMEYTTLSALKMFAPSTGLTDPQLSALITRGSLLLDAELWDNIGEQTLTKRMDGYGKPKIVMEAKVNSVTSVEYKESGSWYEIDVDFIDWPVVHLEEPAPKGDKNIRIVYVKGYTVLPTDIQAFFHTYLMRLLTLDKASTGATAGEVKSKSINGLSISYRTPWEIAESETSDGGAFSEAYKSILSKYKNFTWSIA